MLKLLDNGSWMLEGVPLRPGDRVEVYGLDGRWRQVILVGADLAPTRSLVSGLAGSAIRRPSAERPPVGRRKSPRSRKRW